MGENKKKKMYKTVEIRGSHGFQDFLEVMNTRMLGATVLNYTSISLKEILEETVTTILWCLAGSV